jgi:histone H3/H4
MPKYLVVRSNIKEHAKVNERTLNISTDFYEKLNEKVISMIKEACRRAKENNRNTVMGKDI